MGEIFKSKDCPYCHGKNPYTCPECNDFGGFGEESPYIPIRLSKEEYERTQILNCNKKTIVQETKTVQLSYKQEHNKDNDIMTNLKLPFDVFGINQINERIKWWKKFIIITYKEEDKKRLHIELRNFQTLSKNLSALLIMKLTMII